MCKKLAVVALLVAAGVVALQRFDIRCKRKSCSPEQQIQALEQRLANLEPEKRKLINAIAVEEVAIKNLREEIVGMEGRLETQKKRILALRADIQSGKEFVKFDEREVPLARAKTRLTRDFTAYKSAQEELKSKKNVLEARQDTLDAAYDQLASFENMKRELVVELANTKAKLKKVRAAQTRSRVQYDNSEFSRIKSGISKVRNTVDVDEKKVELEARFSDRPARVETKKKEADVLKEIDTFFSPAKPAESK